MNWKEEKQQREVRARIEEQKLGCYHCFYFDKCHMAAWLNGATCDMFICKTTCP